MIGGRGRLRPNMAINYNFSVGPSTVSGIGDWPRLPPVRGAMALPAKNQQGPKPAWQTLVDIGFGNEAKRADLGAGTHSLVAADRRFDTPVGSFSPYGQGPSSPRQAPGMQTTSPGSLPGWWTTRMEDSTLSGRQTMAGGLPGQQLHQLAFGRPIPNWSGTHFGSNPQSAWSNPMNILQSFSQAQLQRMGIL